MSLRKRLVRRALDDGGITIVEVVVAGLILVIGSLALLLLVDTTAHSSYRAEQSQVVSDRLQQEVEAIKQLPYGEIALTSLPPDSSDTGVPSWRVSGTSFATSQDGSGVQPLVYNGSPLYEGGTVEAGAISPTPEPFQSGDVSGTIYRFVTWEDDPSCPPSDCPGAQDAKRVIVSILLDRTAPGGTRFYQELQAQITDPEAEPVGDENPIGASTNDAKPWTFWLSDTSCDREGREPISSDHLTHNTRGVCENGLRTGNDPGAPDLMFPEAPPFNAESPIFDYATDVEPTSNSSADRGLQLVTPSQDGCPSYPLEVAAAPDDPPDRFQKVHKWLSEPIPSGYEIELNGEAHLNLWTQTVNGTIHPGAVCAWLFVRKGSGEQAADTPAENALGLPYFHHVRDPWPSGWSEIHIPLVFSLAERLDAGSRLGVAISVERAGSAGAGGLQFMYDEPSFDSRLEVKTSSDLPTL